MMMMMTACLNVNLFQETRYPLAVPFEHKGVALVRHSYWGRFDPERLVPDIDFQTSHRIAIERIRSGQTLTQLSLIEQAWAPSIEIENQRRSALGARVEFLTWWDVMGVTFHTITTCAQCREPMAVSDTRARYCTVDCYRASRREKIRPFNVKRPKAIQQPMACLQCNQLFTPKRRDAKFCSGRCRVARLRGQA